jgi:predicted phosphodiesterase
MTYDKESDLAVLFGGITDEQYQATGLYGDNETWTYDYNTNTWTNMSPATAPSMRCLSDMVYDEESDIIILYGGLRFNDLDDYPLGDTWAYDVNTDTWTNMSPAVSPGMRYVYSMTYDSKSDRIVLFGGVNLTHNLDDTWMYDYNTNTWTEMSPGASPSPRNAAAIVYDEKEELVVLFGGYVFGYPYEMADTWVYNTTADTWTEMSPTNHPSKRSEMKAVYDSSVDKIIMFGGWAYDVVFDETWSYNYTSNIWIELNTPNAPSSRYWYGIAFDSESDRTILFSGNDGLIGEMNILEADTWAYKYQINPPSGPLNFDVSMSGVNLVLTWDAPVTHPETPITGYNVYIGSSSGTYTLKAQLGNVLTYTDTSVPPGIRQYYVVTAVCSIGEGDYSDEDYGEIPLDVPDDGIYTFIAYGDTRSSDETAVSSLHSTIVSKFLQGDPEFVIHTGDMVNHGGEAYQWPLFEESISLIRDADPPIPFYGAVGNHEWYTDIYDVNDEDYSNYLAWADYSDVVDGDETELYYSFDRENIHFIVLNTVETWVGDDYTCPTAQWDWLVSDFEANQYEFIIVSFHNPMYSVRADRPDRWAQAESLRDTFQSLFEANGVDIVFNGHDHHYYRTVRNGIQYIVTGGGGAPLYDLQYIDTVWQAGDRGFKAYHFLNCSILPYNETHDQLSVGVVLMNGDVQDSFELLIPLPPIITTTPTTPTTPTGYTDPPPFDWVMTVVIVGGVAVVLVVLVLIVRKRS